MIRISVDTEEELSRVRKVLQDVACWNGKCPSKDGNDKIVDCRMCQDYFYKNRVLLFKREVVEEPAPIVV